MIDPALNLPFSAFPDEFILVETAQDRRRIPAFAAGQAEMTRARGCPIPLHIDLYVGDDAESLVAIRLDFGIAIDAGQHLADFRAAPPHGVADLPDTVVGEEIEVGIEVARIEPDSILDDDAPNGEFVLHSLKSLLEIGGLAAGPGTGRSESKRRCESQSMKHVPLPSGTRSKLIAAASEPCQLS